MSAASQEKIRRASADARKAMEALDADRERALEKLYREVAGDLQKIVEGYGDKDGSLSRAPVSRLLAEINARLDGLVKRRNQMLDTNLRDAAALGADPWRAAFDPADLSRLADDAVQFVLEFQASDGLTLSDRLWRVDTGAQEAIEGAVRKAVAAGVDASAAAQSLLNAGTVVPAEVLTAVAATSASAVAKGVRDLLTTAPDNAYANALRIFRTELNRAHGEAYIAGVQKHPETAGLRFLLSPNHRRRDICDMWANANLYGMGRGVYPVDKCPWPAHPNTLSFVVVVFFDEVTDDDRRGQQTGLDWLRDQSAEDRELILGKQKAAALRNGKLREEHIGANWRDIKEEINGM